MSRTFTLDSIHKTYISQISLFTFKKNAQPQVKKALSGVSITLTPGLYGLLGPNGAGKSTLIHIITGTLAPDSGEVLWCGKPAMGIGFRRILGYMPQQQGMYEQFSGERFLYYIAALKGMKKRDAAQQIEKYLELVGLKKDSKRRVGGYSGGMRQRLMFVAALLGDPEILILDEPTAGLDPEERIKIRNYVSELSGERIVILATHVVSDIECIASKILLLYQGKLLAENTPGGLIDTVTDKVYEKICTHEELGKLMKEYPKGNVSQGVEGIHYRIVQDECPEGFTRALGTPDLEDVYLYWLKK